jgi:hypothetical protein
MREALVDINPPFYKTEYDFTSAKNTIALCGSKDLYGTCHWAYDNHFVGIIYYPFDSLFHMQWFDEKAKLVSGVGEYTTVDANNWDPYRRGLSLHALEGARRNGFHNADVHSLLRKARLASATEECRIGDSVGSASGSCNSGRNSIRSDSGKGGSKGRSSLGGSGKGGSSLGGSDKGGSSLGGSGKGGSNLGGGTGGGSSLGGSGKGESSLGGSSKGESSLGGSGKGESSLGGSGKGGIKSCKGGSNNGGGDGRSGNLWCALCNVSVFNQGQLEKHNLSQLHVTNSSSSSSPLRSSRSSRANQDKA